MENIEFAGKTALVTGAASGIGAALVVWLDHAGIGRIVAIDRDGAGLDRLDLKCAIDRIEGDVVDEALWRRIEACYPDVRFVALNAGIAGPGKLTAELELGEWRTTLAVNLDGMFLGLRAALRVMIAAGAGGSVVMTGSVSGLRAYGAADYAASKAAVHHLARVGAREAAPHGIRVNAIAPGGVDTAIWDQAEIFQAEVARLGSRELAIGEMGMAGSPLGRFATAAEVAAQIGFLLGDRAAMITGAVLPVDGGLSV